MLETIQDLKTRRSCRGYKEEQISEDQLNQILEAGIKGDYVGIGHCVLGYAKDAPAPAKPRKENYIYRV